MGQAAPMVRYAAIWDGSRSDHPSAVARFAEGFLTGEADRPGWTPAALREPTADRPGSQVGRAGRP